MKTTFQKNVPPPSYSINISDLTLADLLLLRLLFSDRQCIVADLYERNLIQKEEKDSLYKLMDVIYSGMY